jgi:hypothetical protein
VHDAERGGERAGTDRAQRQQRATRRDALRSTSPLRQQPHALFRNT